MATGDQLLFLELAKALSRPSKAYRAAQAGLDIPQQAIEGYMSGSGLADKIKDRRLQDQTLEEILGANTPEGLGGTTVRQANSVVKPVEAYASLLKATRESKGSRSQQANFLLNGKLMEYDPDTGYRPARIEGQNNSGPMVIAPRVAPTLPAGEVTKDAGIDDLLNDVSTIRSTKKAEYIGLYDYPKTLASQRTGYGATTDAGKFTQTLSRLQNKILNLRSGGQITDAEAGRLFKELPSGMTSDVDFDAKLTGFENSLKDMLMNRQRGFSGAGYRTPAFGEASVPSFNTPEEAEASGHKGPAIIGGRRAVVH